MCHTNDACRQYVLPVIRLWRCPGNLFLHSFHVRLLPKPISFSFPNFSEDVTSLSVSPFAGNFLYVWPFVSCIVAELAARLFFQGRGGKDMDVSPMASWVWLESESSTKGHELVSACMKVWSYDVMDLMTYQLAVLEDGSYRVGVMSNSRTGFELTRNEELSTKLSLA